MIGDLINTLSGAAPDEKKARKAHEAALAAFEGLELPEYEDINFVAPEYAGDVTSVLTRPDDISVDPVEAALMEASTVGPSAMQDITTDPRLRDAQLNALASLEGIAEAGGMTAQDEANMSRMINSVNQQDRGRREAIQQGMARRGMGGSGMELLAQLQSSQGATDRAAQQGLDIQGMAQARALEAMMQSGQLGGAIRGQDFSEDAAKASAADAIARFNASQRQGANQYNTGSINSMGQFNAGMDFNSQNANIGNEMRWGQHIDSIATGNRDAQQNIKYAEADAANKSLTHNNFTIPSTQFGDATTKASGVAGGHKGMADYHAGAADRDRQTFQGLVEGGAKVGAAAVAGPAGPAAVDAASATYDDDPRNKYKYTGNTGLA